MAKGNIHNFRFIVTVDSDISQMEGGSSSKMKGTGVAFQVEGDIDPKVFYDEENHTITEFGLKATTETLLYGLMANIHRCHQFGAWDSAKHLRHIIAKLEEGFALADVKVTKEA